MSHALTRLAAVTALAAFSSIAGAADYTYTDVRTAIQNYTGVAPSASRTLSVTANGSLVGYYSVSTSSSVRNYFTLAPGATAVTPYAAGQSYAYAAPTSPSGTGGLVLANAAGTYLTTTMQNGSPTSAGGYNTASGVNTALPTDTTYNGTYTNPYITTGNTTQTQSVTNVTPYSINASGNIVGVQNYTSDNSSTSTFTHGFVYNAATGKTTDIGGGAAGQPAATGFSTLSGISDTNVVVGSANEPNTFRSTPTDAIVGTAGSGGGYTFTDLASSLGTLVASGSTYYSSSASAISQNGRYVVGVYQYRIGTGTTNYTKSFRLDELTGAVIDLGAFTTTSTSLVNALGVNDSGVVVGIASNGGVNHGFVYNGSLIDLNATPGGVGGVPASTTITGAYGINDAGQIVGVATIGSVTNNAFLLTATPEPTTLAGLTVLGGVLVRRRSRRV